MTSSDPVTIPADLAADVAAHPDRYRPDVNPGTTEVLAFSRDRAEAAVGCVAIAHDVMLDVVLPGGGHTYPKAWALVGSVDGGPRPDVGDRVLALDAFHDGAVVKGVVMYASNPGDPIVVRATVGLVHGVRSWALLPAAPSCPRCHSHGEPELLATAVGPLPCSAPWHGPDVAPLEACDAARDVTAIDERPRRWECSSTEHQHPDGARIVPSLRLPRPPALPAAPDTELACSCAPDESGAIVHNSWAHQPSPGEASGADNHHQPAPATVTDPAAREALDDLDGDTDQDDDTPDRDDVGTGETD